MTPGIVAVLEAADNAFGDHARSTVSAAQELATQLSSEVTVVVLPPAGSAESVTVDWDVAELVVVDNAAGVIDGLAAQKIVGDFLADRTPSLVLMPHGGIAVELAAGLAAAGGYGFGGNVQSVRFEDGALTATRLRFSGKVVETLGFDLERTNVLTIRDGSFAPAPRAGGAGPVTTSTLPANERALAQRVDIVASEAGQIDITKAEFLLAIGRGVDSEESVAKFAALAEKLGATLAASRPLVDVGWVDAARQVGQSGKTVKPKVYFALGISGSIQHVAGMRGASTIIAVNSDASAPIFEIADYGAVMDMDELADALESVLASN